MRAFIFDTEIIGIIITNPDDYAALQERGCGGLRYANGWTDYKGMGIACVCAWDSELGAPLVFLNTSSADNLGEFQTCLDKADLLVSVNGVKFDVPLLKANGFTIRPELAHYDILRECWAAGGLNPDKFSPKTHGGFGLDALCMANFGIGKTDGGAVSKDTPRLFQTGEIGRVISNCLRDVALTKRLFDHVVQCGWLRHPKRDGLLKMANPYQQEGWLKLEE